MGSAPVRRTWQTRAASSVRRGAYVAPGVAGVRRVRDAASNSGAAPAASGSTTPPGDLVPVYWYDAADATTSDWPGHGAHGATLAAGGTPTLVPSAVNGQPGVRLDTGEGYGGSETAHAFTAGMTALYVVKMGTNPGSKLQINAGASTSYVWSDSSFGEIQLLYNDELGDSVTYVYDAPAAGGAAYICEWTVSAAGVPSLKVAGVTQTPTSTSGSAGGTTESVSSLSIGVPAQSPTVCELMVYDADDSAGLSDARTFLATKYALSA